MKLSKIAERRTMADATIERVEEWLKAPSVQTWPDIADIRALVAAARRAEHWDNHFKCWTETQATPRKAKKGRSERR